MKVISILTLCLVLNGFVACEMLSKPQQSKNINERWVTSNKTFKIRVTTYQEENGGFVPGGYYVFESAKLASDDWHEVVKLRHDDLVPIPKDQVRFVTEQTGYFFMVYDLAVTSDGGTTWSTWNIIRNFPDWHHNRPSIKDVRIASDGTGIMELTSSTNQEARPLRSSDYGRHWRMD